MNIAPPNLLVIGAARAGTTSLYYALRRHPDVFMCPTKETSYFAQRNGDFGLPIAADVAEELRTRSILSWNSYMEQFSAAGGVRWMGEASPLYLYSPHAPRRIFDTLGKDVALVAILRHPAERAYSSYLRRANTDPSVASFLRSIESEAAADPSAIRSLVIPLVEGGMYGEQLERYYDNFPADRILILLYEELGSGIAEALLWQFLDLESNDGDALIEVHNQSGIPRWRIVDRAIRRSRPLKLLAKKLLPDTALKKLVGAKNAIQGVNLATPPAVPMEVKVSLTSRFFSDDLARVGELTGRDLSHWL
jgi:hypothetical protein